MKTIPKLPLRYHKGKLFWTESRSNRIRIGQEAGSLDGDGYIRIKFKGIHYQAHRIIWTIHNGAIPTGHTIDHVNRIKTDNRIKNLRLAATGTEQQGNSIRKGYTWCKGRNKFRAQINVGGNRNKHLGYYDNELDAKAAYIRAHREIHKEFSPYK